MASGYGSDTWCGDSLVTGRMSRGVKHVVLALYRRLITPRGTLRPLNEDSNEDELNYGFDVAQFVGAVAPEVAVLIAPSQIAAEVEKDDRVLAAYSGGRYAYETDGTAVLYFDVTGALKAANESFTFTVQIKDLETSLLL
jgi:hypothetical protein